VMERRNEPTAHLFPALPEEPFFMPFA
jgi:hypothetical protein